MFLPEYPQRLSPTMIVQHVFISGREGGQHAEHSLRHPRDEGFHGLTALQLEQLQAPARGREQA